MLFVASNITFAQVAKVELALIQLKEGKLDSAKMNIDAATLADETKTEVQTWMVRGFIYKELYKAREITNYNSPYREEAAKSLLKAHELDVNHLQTKPINDQLKFIAAKYNNDASKTLDTLRYQQSITNFEKYIQLQKIIDPNFNPKPKELEFYLALFHPFEEAFKAKKNEYEYIDAANTVKRKFAQHFYLAETYLQKALSVDSLSKSANKNYGLLYYNRGVNLIMNCPFDIDLDKLKMIQDTAEKYFSIASLPYMLKAHRIDPLDETVIEGIIGIYWNLNDQEKVKYYQKLLKIVKAIPKGEHDKYYQLNTKEKQEYYKKLSDQVKKMP